MVQWLRYQPYTLGIGVRFSLGPFQNVVENSGFETVSLEKRGSVEKAGSGCVFPELPNAGREKQGPGLDFHDFLRYAEHISNIVSKNKLEQLRTIVTRAHGKRYDLLPRRGRGYPPDLREPSLPF